MANLKLSTSSATLKTTICLLLFALFLGCATAARMLDESVSQSSIPTDQPDTTDPPVVDDDEAAPVVSPDTTLPSGQIPASVTTPPVVDPPIPLPTVLAPEVAPSTTVSPAANVPNTVTAPVASVAPGAKSPVGPAAVAATSANVAQAGGEHPTMSFFMHDILGGSHPSSRVVTGIVANSQANGLPFSKSNSQVFPINGGVPLNNINSIVNNNNVPFLVGLNGSPTSTVLQNSGNNNVVSNGNNLPFVSAGQLPAGLTLQQLMFGSITVVDNELTETHELGSVVLGKGQGFYLASSLDGSSHTFALTTLFHGSDHEVDDTISFFGVHRTASMESHVSVIGGTGKYENAKGYAIVETLPQVDQHTTDGVETILHFTVYLTAP